MQVFQNPTDAIINQRFVDIHIKLNDFINVNRDNYIFERTLKKLKEPNNAFKNGIERPTVVNPKVISTKTHNEIISAYFTPVYIEPLQKICYSN